MEHYGRLYPVYGYDRHKGYPTKEHRRLVKEHGPSPIQRLTFRSIAF
jgi:ribonuclease HII